MKLYIVGPKKGGEGVYSIVTEEGEGLASHYCSHKCYARNDLEARRPERQEEWKKRFGEYEVLFIGDDELTREKLLERNAEWAKNDEEKADVPQPEITVSVTDNC